MAISSLISPSPLLKDRLGDVGELVRALRIVAEGGSVIDPAVVDAMLANRAQQERSPLAALTPGELDVLREMARGRTNAGIAETLIVSESSVDRLK